MKKILACMLAVVMLVSCSMTAFAATNDYVPSIEIKPGPEVIEQETDDGRPGMGIIVMPNGEQIPVPGGSIIITPIVDKDKADQDIRDALEEAFSNIKDAGGLDELVKDLQDILDKIANGTDVDDLVITDIFHIFLSDEYNEYLEKGGKLHIKLQGVDGLIAALQNAGGKWGVLFGDMFIDNGDGTYTLVIDKMGVYALFRDAGKVDVDYADPDKSSPQTGDMTVMFMVAFVVLASCAAAALVIYKKKRV